MSEYTPLETYFIRSVCGKYNFPHEDSFIIYFVNGNLLIEQGHSTVVKGVKESVMETVRQYRANYERKYPEFVPHHNWCDLPFPTPRNLSNEGLLTWLSSK